MPGALKAVAWVLIGFGALALLDMVAALFIRGAFSPNPAVFELFAGIGILNRSPGWFNCGLVCVVITMGLSAVACVVLLGFAIFDDNEQLKALVVALFMAGIFALGLWQYRVLTRPDVQKLFDR